MPDNSPDNPAPRAPGKHAQRSAETRQKFIDTAQAMYALRSIDAVSVNEITIAAGQKNRNALQYHFGNRDGLLQAIIDQHAARVREIRRPLLDALCRKPGTARSAATALVQPLIEYVENNSCGVHYVKILSQLAAIHSPDTNPGTDSGLSFDADERLERLMREAIVHLGQAEATQRLFLVITMTFHGIADICRAHVTNTEAASANARSALFAQVTLAVEAILAAPASAKTQYQ